MTNDIQGSSHSSGQRALDAPKQPPSLHSVPTDWPARLADVEVKLRTVEPRHAMAELAACLTLVAPAGMSSDDRTEWLKVAAMTIGDVPQGAMKVACEEARKTVRRVSDLVPFISEKAEEEQQRLRSSLANIRWQIDHPSLPAISPPPKEEAKPFTVEELLNMTPFLRKIARRNGFASAETFAEVDRILDERQQQAAGGT